MASGVGGLGRFGVTDFGLFFVGCWVCGVFWRFFCGFLVWFTGFRCSELFVRSFLVAFGP